MCMRLRIETHKGAFTLVLFRLAGELATPGTGSWTRLE